MVSGFLGARVLEEARGTWGGPGSDGARGRVEGVRPAGGRLTSPHSWSWAGAGQGRSGGHQRAPPPPGPGLVPGPGTFISRAFLSLLRSMRHSSDMHFSRLAARWRYSIS